jgi:transposase
MTGKQGSSPESIVREIKRKTRRKFTAEEKIRIVLEGLRGEAGITDLCRKEGIHPTMYYKWSKAFLEAGKRQRKRWTCPTAPFANGIGDTTKRAMMD